MKLKIRARMILTVVLAFGVVRVALHIAASAVWFPELVDLVQDGVEHRMVEQGGREACEASPSTWPRVADSRDKGRPFVQLYAYDASLTSANPDAPTLSSELLDEFSADGHVDMTRGLSGPGRLLFRMPWSGPCAYVLAEETDTTDHLIPAPHVQPLLFVASLALVVFFAAHQLVRRVRRLAEQVETSAQGGFHNDIEVAGHDELADVAHRFNDAIRQVRASLATANRREQALRTYIANTTHDVMIPLTVLQGHLVRVQRAAREGTAPEGDVVRGALYEAHYMGSLMHNLAAVARLESLEGALRMHPVDLGALVERVVLRHAPIAEERGLALEHASPPQPLHVRGDVTLLEQAVSNLVSNAIRHHDAETGNVALVLQSDGERFGLRVRDDGPGVPEHALGRLTERTFQVDDARGRSEGGLGLGLAICADVCARHDFDLSFDRLEPRGLEVSICGPLASLGDREDHA